MVTGWCHWNLKLDMVARCLCYHYFGLAQLYRTFLNVPASTELEVNADDLATSEYRISLLVEEVTLVLERELSFRFRLCFKSFITDPGISD